MANDELIPRHVGIILDGNRRWAKERGLPTFFGHRKGMENAKRIILHAQKRGVKVVTMFAFSTENWKREAKEVGYLMKLFENYLDKHLKVFKMKGVRLMHIGSMKELPEGLQKKLKKSIDETKNNKGVVACLALNYGGQDEIRRMVQKLISKGVRSSEVDFDLISKNLDTKGLPDPDLIIRTSGEQRTSGFLIWQASYSELYFPKVHWPDYDEKEFDRAIVEYNRRQRRFGR